MSGNFFCYDPNNITIVGAGVPIDGGFADGAFVEIAYDSDAFVDVVGTDGDVTRSKTNDRRATITISLMSSSNNNTLFSLIHNIDLGQDNGAGVGPALIKDNQGTTLFAAEKSWVMKTPDRTFDKTATAVVWKIRCADLKCRIGGN